MTIYPTVLFPSSNLEHICVAHSNDEIYDSAGKFPLFCTNVIQHDLFPSENSDVLDDDQRRHTTIFGVTFFFRKRTPGEVKILKRIQELAINSGTEINLLRSRITVAPSNFLQRHRWF